MRPRTSITCMWKRGFIGDIVPTARILPTSFITTRYVLSTMRGARSSAWQYLPGRQSFTCLPWCTCWKISRRIFSPFRNTRCSVTRVSTLMRKLWLRAIFIFRDTSNYDSYFSRSSLRENYFHFVCDWNRKCGIYYVECFQNIAEWSFNKFLG